MMDHDEIRSLIPAYALGAVPAEELGRIRDHILSCEECMADADSYARVTGALALATDPVPLPAGFEDAVMNTVRAERAEVAPKARRRWSPAWLVAAAAVTIAMAVLAGALFQARDDVTERDQNLALRDRAITQLLHSEGTGLALAGERGRARLIPRNEGSLFVATGLGEAPDDRTFQLWLMRGPGCPASDECEIASAGTFDARGGLVYFELDDDVSAWDAGAVTIEPRGGSEGPTTEPIISSFAAGR